MTRNLRDSTRLIAFLGLTLGLGGCSLVVNFDRDMIGPLCGDGLAEGEEQCDDGALATGDGCDDSCVVEGGWTCYGSGATSCLELPSGTLSGVGGFSTDDYYGQTDEASLVGSDSMTRSILFRLDTVGSQQTLFEHVVGPSGWSMVITRAGELHWRLYAGGVPSILSSTKLNPGSVYAVTGSWDGTTQRLAVNGTAIASQPGTFTPAGAGSVANIGQAFGANPASGSTILGLAASDSIALTDAQMQTHNEACIASGQMESFPSAENVWQAPDIETDTASGLDWSTIGTPSAVNVD